MRCPWCSNPENLCNKREKYIKDGAEGIYGIYYSEEELFENVIKDVLFYGEKRQDYQISDAEQLLQLPGGVTFSGGEALLQINEMEKLLLQLKNEHIHLTVETCLFIPIENLKKAISFIDLFYVDVKIMDEILCNKILL